VAAKSSEFNKLDFDCDFIVDDLEALSDEHGLPDDSADQFVKSRDKSVR
jgi:hypothetical protein